MQEFLLWKSLEHKELFRKERKKQETGKMSCSIMEFKWKCKRILILDEYTLQLYYPCVLLFKSHFCIKKFKDNISSPQHYTQL